MLTELLSPRSVAVVGAARATSKVGHIVLRNLIQAGFTGPIYPVNPHTDEVLGLKAYPSLRDLPAPCDLAVVVVPAPLVAGVVDDCAAAGVRALIVISAGFRESGPEGAALERHLVERARALGIRVLGPNCLGLIVSDSRLNASFAGAMPPPGPTAFISQSGALGTAILDYAAGEGIGFSHFASLGNKADLSEVELMRAFADSERCRVIAVYLESVVDGPGFIASARDVVSRKPVVVLKSGVSDAGARAVSSHTGSLAGADVAYDAAFRRAGVLRARSVQELFDLALGLSRQPMPSGPGLAILSNAGGPAVIATDACETEGVALASLDGATIAGLHDALPAAASVYNPVDVLGDADASRYERALDLLAADPGVRSLLVILTPQAMTQPAQTAEVVVTAARASGKPTFACFMGHDSVAEAWEVLRAGGVPQFPFPERAVATLAAMERYVRARDARAEDVPDLVGDVTAVREVLAEHWAAGRTFVTGQQAADILAAAGVAVPPGVVARDFSTARRFAEEVGYPVVLKIASPDILHKSDVGGIRSGIADEAELRQAYDEVLARTRSYAPEAVVDGVHVQRQVPAGREVIVGVDRDPQFGPLVMFGLGGIYVEVLKDVSFRLAPVTQHEARQMIAEVRSYGLLRGARGAPAADVEAVADAIVRVSQLALACPEIMELDVNPLIVGDAGAGAVAADVRIGIGGPS